MTSRLGTGKWLTFFYSVGLKLHVFVNNSLDKCWDFFYKKDDIWGVLGVKLLAMLLLLVSLLKLTSLLLLECLLLLLGFPNIPGASAVAVDSAVANVIAAVDIT